MVSPATLLVSLSKRRLFAAIVLFAAALLVYAPALSGEFIWDDGYLVGENPFFKSPVFALEVFRHYLFLDSFCGYYRPVQNLSYMFDYWLWDHNSFGYHLSNVFFHATSGFLIFLLLGKLIAPLLEKSQTPDSGHLPRLTAFLIAFVWVIHPIHNAAVAYISGRADSLACLFAVSAWLLWMKSSGIRLRALAYAGSALLVLTALCSKEIAIVWIALFCLHLLFFAPERGRKEKLITIGCLALILAGYWFLRNLPGARIQPVGDPGPDLAARTLLMLRALGDYVSLIFFPLTLHMERTVFQQGYYRTFGFWQSNVWFEYLSLIGAATLAGSAWFSFHKSPGRKLRCFGALWFAVGFLPISNLFPLNAQCAEHWIYMPSIGFLIFLAGCLTAAPLGLQRACVWLVCLSSVLLGLRTSKRSDDWSGVEKLLTRTVIDGGGTCRIYVNLAAERLKRGDTAMAEKMLRETLNRFPQYSPARISLGLVLLREGRKDEAAPYLTFQNEEADLLAHSYPDTWQASLNLAHMHQQAGDDQTALQVLDDSLTRYPDVWELLRLKATLLQQTVGPAEAVKMVRAYSNSHWWRYDTFMQLGRLEAAAGNAEAAITSFRHAALLDIHSVEPFSSIAKLELASKHPLLAFESQKQAIKRAPDQPTQYLLLAVILDELGRSSEASHAMARAEKLRASAGKG